MLCGTVNCTYNAIISSQPILARALIQMSKNAIKGNFCYSEEILKVGNMSRNMKGIGFESSLTKKRKISYKKFVLPEKKYEFQIVGHMSQPHARHVYPQHRGYKRCHHCGRSGHIRLYCYKLYGYPHIVNQDSRKKMARRFKKRRNGNQKQLSIV